MELAAMAGSVADVAVVRLRSAQAPACPLRVLAVVPGNSVGAGFVFVQRQLRSLRRLGVEVHELCLPSRTSLGCLVHTWKELKHKVQSLRPDVIHSHYGTVTSFLCSLMNGVPLVITFRGSDLQPHPSVGWMRRNLGLWLSQLSALRARNIICVSHHLRNELWWGRRKVTVVPTGVDLELFHPMPHREARAALGWDLVERVVLFCATTEPVAKGLRLVEEAVAHAEGLVGPVRLQVLDGGFDPDAIPLFLNAADCLAFASLHEGSPNVVKEALACNLPVVSVDVGDVRDRLAGVSPSSIVKRDAREFGAALAEILKAGRRSNGRESVRRCSEMITAQAIFSVYAKAAHRPQMDEA